MRYQNSLEVIKEAVQGVEVPGEAEIKPKHTSLKTFNVFKILSILSIDFASTMFAVFQLASAPLKGSVKQWQYKREEPHQFDICVIRGKQACTIGTLPSDICLISVLTVICGRPAGSRINSFDWVAYPSRFEKSVKHLAKDYDKIV